MGRALACLFILNGSHLRPTELQYLQFGKAPRWLKCQPQLRTSTVEKRPESEKGQFKKPYSLNPKYSNTRVV